MARTACRDVFDELMDILSEHEYLIVAGFGKFEVKKKKYLGSLPRWAKATDFDRLENYPYLKFTPADNLRRSMYIGEPQYYGKGRGSEDWLYIQGLKTSKYGHGVGRLGEDGEDDNDAE